MPTPDLPKVEAAIVQLTNEFRREQKLGAVAPNPVLRKAAEDFARFLARTGSFSHTADGRQPGDRAKAAGYEFCIVSENLSSNLDSRGFATQQLARDAVEGWKGSPGHRKNMVDPNVTDIAVAVARAPGEEKYLSVQLFGRPISQRYEFTVSNASELPVAYSFAGTAHTIEKRRIITHTVCVPGILSFVGAGSWLSKQSLSAAFSVTPGANFLVEPNAHGAGVTVKHIDVSGVKSGPARPGAAATQPVSSAKR